MYKLDMFNCPSLILHVHWKPLILQTHPHRDITWDKQINQAAGRVGLKLCTDCFQDDKLFCTQ